MSNRTPRTSLATTALAALFCVSALSACGQYNQKKKKPHDAHKAYAAISHVGKKKSPLENLSVFATVASRHSDRVTPYNEFNPGLMVAYDLKTPRLNKYGLTLSPIFGGYDNSYGQLTLLGGVLGKKKWRRLGFGLVAGAVTYREDMADNVLLSASAHALPEGQEMPHSYSPKRGMRVKYEPTPSGAYWEQIYEVTAKGIGKTEIFPAAAAVFSVDILQTRQKPRKTILALNALAVWHPDHGSLVTGAIEYHPFHRMNSRYSPR